MNRTISPLRDLVDSPALLTRAVEMSASGGFDWSARDFAADRPGKWDLSFGATVDGTLVGYIVCSFLVRSAHIHQIVVDEAHRGTGLADELVARLRTASADLDLVSLTLKVEPTNNRARSFYRRHDFEIIDSKAGTDSTYERWEALRSGSRIVAVHQPNFLPNLGYFHKLDRADVFILLDTVQLPRGRSFANRNRVLATSEPQWLTVPVQKAPAGSDGKMEYREALVADEQWGEKALRTLQANYAQAAAYHEVVERLAPLMQGSQLATINENLIRSIASMLGIDTEIVRQSDLPRQPGQRSALIAGLCTAVDATHYLSGSGGGRDYNEPEVFHDAGLMLRYNEPNIAPYRHVRGDEFHPHLSVVDALLTLGPAGTTALLRQPT